MSEFNRYREEEMENEQIEKEEADPATENCENCCGKCHEEAINDECNCQAEIAKLQAEIANLNDQLLRNRAELENFKRRSNEERIRERKYALQDFFTEFINITDIFSKVVNSKTEDEKLQKYLTGFQLINNQIQDMLAQYGVKPIAALKQKFDPSFHSAVETVWVEGVEDDIIVEEIITGYMYKDRILRPSVVKVNKTSAKPNEIKEENE